MSRPYFAKKSAPGIRVFLNGAYETWDADFHGSPRVLKEVASLADFLSTSLSSDWVVLFDNNGETVIDDKPDIPLSRLDLGEPSVVSPQSDGKVVSCDSLGDGELDGSVLQSEHGSSPLAASDGGSSGDENSIGESSDTVREAVSGPHSSSISQGEGQTCGIAGIGDARDWGIVIAALEEWARGWDDDTDPGAQRARELAEDAASGTGIFAAVKEALQ